MSSIFDGFEPLIHEALLLGPNQHLKQKSTCNSLVLSDELIKNVHSLVPDMYEKINDNWSGRIPSKANWVLRNETFLSPQNTSPEVLLERAVVQLSERSLLNGWHNQMPIASGLIDEVSDKRAAVDWVYMEGDNLNLVELKWASDTPLYAMFEILRYGLAYLFCYQHREAFGFADLPTMKVSSVKLTTLAPHEYYSGYNFGWLENELSTAINTLFKKESHGLLNCQFNCSSFPMKFTLPFETGEDVLALRGFPVDHPSIASLLNAMNNQTPAWGDS